LMIPWPSLIFNHIALPLQLLASRIGEGAIRLFNVPVLREGNILTLANTQLEVAEACSGIRSLISLLTIAIMFVYFTNKSIFVRTITILSMIPIAIIVNALRITGSGLAAYLIDVNAATGFYHTFSGWLIFVVATIMMYVVYRMVSYVSLLIFEDSALKHIHP
jgi:exosortase